MKSVIQSIEENFFAVGRYWGSLNSSVIEDGSICSMITGISSGDLNWTWNEKPLTVKDSEKIKKVKKHYEEIKLPSWWWVYPSGQSEQIRLILQSEGFQYLDSIPCMAFDASRLVNQNVKTETVDIKSVNKKEELKIWADLSFAGFEMTSDTKNQYNKFVSSFDISAESPQKLFLAFWEGNPVGTALLFIYENTAGIYFVSTIKEMRRKGIGLALTNAAIRYAANKELEYCVLQSSRLGIKVYQQAGFKEYCRADVYRLKD